MPTLSVIVVLHNSAAELVDCLASIADEVESGWAELILVDNASPDDGVAVARETLPDALVLSLPANRGFAGGVNAALPEARGRYVLLLNPDVSVPPNGLRELAAWLDAHPAVGVASPDLGDTDGGTAAAARAVPSIWRTVLEASRAHRLMPAELRSRALLGPYWSGHDETDVGWVPGTAMLIRREAIDQVGGLSEHMFMYGEDIEWCWRLRRAGWRVGVCAGTRFVHRASASARRSWGDAEREWRIASGVHAACVVMYGRWHARTLAAVVALAMMLEARTPGGSTGQRAATAAGARRWLELARSG